MKTLTKRILALTGVLALGLGAVRAQSDGALLDALVKKGVLSDQEAEDIRASEAKDYATTSAGKLSIADHITNLKLYGDARMRFEYLDEKPQNGGPGGVLGATQGDNVIERNRYRLRIGADYTFTDNFKAGVELESNTADDSANQTMGTGYQKFPINVGLVYLQWKPIDWLTLTGGKQRNPLYTTDLVWDPDIEPEGGSEVASWTFPIGGDEAPAPTHDAKDMKSIAPAAAEPSEMSFTVGLTAFQGIMWDNNEFNARSAAVGGPLTNATDVWQFVEQVPVQFNFDKNTFVKVVPGFDTYTSGGNTTTGAANTGQTNFTGPNIADHLEIVTAPGEFDWKMWDQPFKFYWDFAANLDGKTRVQNVLLGNGQVGIAGVTVPKAQAQNKALGDNVAWLAGLQVGQNKKKGDWSLKGDFRQTGLGSVDPNTNDSDFAGSELNQQGIKLQSQYNFTDFLIGSLTYYDTWSYKNSLFNGATPGQTPTGLPLAGGAGAAAGNYAVGATPTAITGLVGVANEQRLQVDLMWKF